MENLLKDTDQIQEKEKQNKPGFVDNFIQKIQRMVEGAMGGRQRTETEKEGDRYANQDLNAFKKNHKITRGNSVAYIGCGDDSTVQKIFPQTINVDMLEPCNWYLKNFIKSDVFNLPFKDASMDLLVQKSMSYKTEADPRCTKELARVLRSNGRIFRNFPEFRRAVELDEALCGLQYCLILKSYHENGLVFEERHSSKNATFKKGKATPDEIRKLDEQVDEYSKDFFEFVEDIPLKIIEETKTSPFFEGRWRYHEAIEFVLGINLGSDEESILEQLGKLQSKIKPEIYEKIELMVKVLKKNLSNCAN